MQFTVADPLIKLWKEVENIEQISIAASSPYSQQQVINIALHVIKATNDYQQGLHDWYGLPAVNQTWLRLKQHFQTARRNLKKIRGASMQDVGFHQANQISSEIQDVKDNIETMQEAQRSVLTAIEENQTMMTQVANHIGNTYRNGRTNFLPPQYI